MKVKICGIKTLEEVEIINKYPVDYVGFVFAPSKRQVSISKAIELKAKLKPSIKTVGVFVNESIFLVNKIATACALDIVQLHGDEDNEYINKINFPVWKNISISTKEFNINREKFSLEPLINSYSLATGVLLDTYSREERGGTGKVFDWSLVKELGKDMADDKILILAGGLDSNNVLEAIDMVSPHIIDVSSSVEINGIKDEDKIEEFLRRIK